MVKPVSKDMSASLRGQKSGGRGAESVNVSGVTKGESMTVPGTGSVAKPPGADHERSAAHYADPMNRVK
jgi:hypothetical protein